MRTADSSAVITDVSGVANAAAIVANSAMRAVAGAVFVRTVRAQPAIRTFTEPSLEARTVPTALARTRVHLAARTGVAVLAEALALNTLAMTRAAVWARRDRGIDTTPAILTLQRVAMQRPWLEQWLGH